MKTKSLVLMCVLLLLIISTSCENKENKIEPGPKSNDKRSSMRVGDGTVTLAEVTVYAISPRGNNIDMVLSWYNQTYQREERQTYSFSMYDGIALDDEMLNSDEFKEKVIAYIKQQLLEIGVQGGLNPAEIAILRTMDVRQIIRYGFIFKETQIYGNQLIGPDGIFRGYPIDEDFNNAFVHLMLSFNLKQSLGSNLALQLLNAHESTQNPSGITSLMDQRNNQIGLNLSSISEEIMLNLAKYGSLWTIQPINGVKTLGQFKYEGNSNPPRWTPQP